MNAPHLAINLLALAVLAPLALADEPAAYAKPELLVGAEELVDHAYGKETTLANANVIYLDVRPAPPRDVDAANELPGSRWVNAAEWKAAFGDGDDAAGWAERIGAVVTDANATVVVYDDGVTPTAGRIWWVLKYWGLADVRLLNASVAERQAAAQRIRVSSHLRPIPRQAVPFVAKPSPARLVSTEQVQRISREGSRRLIDSRKPEEFAAGIIPTAVHMDWRTLVDPATGKLLPAADLQKILVAAEVDLNEPAVTYCRSGGRASVNALMLELMGAEDVANYYGSWQAWVRQPADALATPQAEPTR